MIPDPPKPNQLKYGFTVLELLIRAGLIIDLGFVSSSG